MSHLTYELAGNLATVTLDNGAQNRIDTAMVDELNEAVSEVLSGTARAVLVRAEGPDFCFGGDFVDWPNMDRRELHSLFDHYLTVFNRFERMPVPVVVAVRGLCFGGGLELAIRGDVIVASDTAEFGHPEQTLGITTLLGGTYRIAERAGRAKAAEWAYTTTRVPAAEMAHWGIVNRVVPDTDLETSALAYAQSLADGPTPAHAAHKALLRAWTTGGVDAADAVPPDISMRLFDTDDVKGALAAAASAYRAGEPRPVPTFNGH